MLLNAFKFLFICLEVLVFFNLMIIAHEVGHFLAARWRGLVIEKFGIWFGKPIWQKKINGVVYSLGSIPAGGFVALPQLAPMEVMEGKVETPRDQLPPISALDKIIVAFAGPLFSFLLALLFAVVVWKAGRPVSEAEWTTVIGYVAPDSVAAKAGLRPGDNIKKVDGAPVNRWGGMGSDSITWRVVRSEGDVIPIEVERLVDGERRPVAVELKPEIPTTKFWSRKGLRQINIYPAQTPIVGQVKPGTPAAEAQLRPKDAIVGANGKPIYELMGLSETLGETTAEPLRLSVKRNETPFEVALQPPHAAVIAGLTKGFPAEKSGLREGDRVVAIDGQPVISASKLSEMVRGRGTSPVNLTIEHKGKRRDVTLTPIHAENETKPMIGVAWEDDFGIRFDARGLTKPMFPTPLEQIKKAATSIFETIGAIASPKSDVKLQHMGGPVMMMRVYYSFFQLEPGDAWRLAFWFSVVLNVNLALLNLLPIPVLDGGHITLAIVEAIRRRPVNVRFLEYVQTGCAVVIIGFMIYIFFFDVQDFFIGDGPKRARPAAERRK